MFEDRSSALIFMNKCCLGILKKIDWNISLVVEKIALLLREIFSMEEACHVFLPAIYEFQQKAGKPKMGKGGGQVFSQVSWGHMS